MGAFHRKVSSKHVTSLRWILIALLVVLLLVLLLKARYLMLLTNIYSTEVHRNDGVSVNLTRISKNLNLPKQNEFSISLEQRNQMPPRNLDLYPQLPRNHIVIVLYVHNRSQYLEVTVDSLSKVKGIEETLLIVSHDGFYDDMNKIVDKIRFCRVKQIFAPYSPHVYPDIFPGVSPSDCRDKQDPVKKKCIGTADQYGNHRSAKIVSLKHHWWWMMNTVWDGLSETRHHSGHILFIEEDHFIYPNAYRNLQLLIELKPQKCPHCYAANLAPYDVKSRGEGWDSLIAEKMGNVGYSFNRTVWRKIHRKAKEFCSFDDYNWDITMWASVYPSFGGQVYSLRGPKTSAIHFGKCGLHQGQGQKVACIDNGRFSLELEENDMVPNIKSNWEVQVHSHPSVYQAGFRGWGGWGDTRDRVLCLEFSKMYASNSTAEK